MILIKNGYIYTKRQFKKRDILIHHKKIMKIDSNIEINSNHILIDAKEKVVLPGFIDMHVHLREPGFPQKETIQSGTKAASRGGFTTIAAMPNTFPVMDNKKTFQDLQQRIGRDAVIKVLLYSAITKGEEGAELVNFNEMSRCGVIAFSDDGKGIQSHHLMEEAMIKAKSLNKSIVAHCEDDSLVKGGVMHEGDVSRRLGVKGISSRSEFKQVKRDIEIAEKTGCHYHICHISTKESVELVRLAKQKGINVTCEVTPHHLLLCDDDIDFTNSNFKMNPPLRSKDDQNALIEGLKDGTIDIIATDHAPHSIHEKNKGFTDAPFGVVGLETCFSVLYTNLVLNNIIKLETLIDCLTLKPASVFHLDSGMLQVGSDANLTIIDLNREMVIDSKLFLSKGKNTPFEGKRVKGIIEMTIVEGRIVYTESERDL